MALMRISERVYDSYMIEYGERKNIKLASTMETAVGLCPRGHLKESKPAWRTELLILSIAATTGVVGSVTG